MKMTIFFKNNVIEVIEQVYVAAANSTHTIVQAIDKPNQILE